MKLIIMLTILLQIGDLKAETLLEKYTDANSETAPIAQGVLAAISFVGATGTYLTSTSFYPNVFTNDWIKIHQLESIIVNNTKMINVAAERLVVLNFDKKSNMDAINEELNFVKKKNIIIQQAKRELPIAQSLYREKIEKGIIRYFNNAQYGDTNWKVRKEIKVLRFLTGSMLALSVVLSADIILDYMFELRDQTVKDKEKRAKLTEILNKSYQDFELLHQELLEAHQEYL